MAKLGMFVKVGELDTLLKPKKEGNAKQSRPQSSEHQ